MQFTEQQISAVARLLSDRAAEDCGVDKDDKWKIYGESYINSAWHSLNHMSAAAPQVPAKLPKWIDDKKGSDPLVDDLIAYIEQHAAPQVVADERELPPLPVMASATDLSHVMQTPEDWDADYRDTWQKLQVEAHNKRQWRKYALELRALAATPVQAQEPSDEIKSMIDEQDAKENAELNRAPVQPVAVPEAAQQNGGLVRAALIDLLSPAVERAANSGAVSFECQSNIAAIFARGRQALTQSAFDAAPAAQGDAKDAELDRIKRLAKCGTVDSFLLLPEQDKRYWFAMAWQESDLRKLAEERITFLHSTNKDADGYEFGIAKVKFDAAGKIESFLWGLGDNSDLDAAIAAKAAS